MDRRKLVITLLTLLCLLLSLAIYSSPYKWGVPIDDPLGITFFLVLFLFSPLLILMGILGFIKYSDERLHYGILPLSAACSQALPVIDGTLTWVRIHIGLSLGLVILVIYVFLIVSKQLRAKHA